MTSRLEASKVESGPPLALIVDDDDESRTAAAEALRAVGFEVLESDNGLDALKLFKARRPTIALLEVMTPFVDGFSLCRAMRDLPAGDEPTIVMMTDLDDLESLRFGYEAGATDFITKPLNPVLLRHRMLYMRRAAENTARLRKSEREIAHAAYHDALTGLPNRRSLERYMTLLVKRVDIAESRAPLAANRTHGAVFLVDLDGFKRINDTFGHSAGDELICEVARRTATRFELDRSDGDGADVSAPLLVRLGGDEFVYVDPRVTSPEEAGDVAQSILDAIGRVFEIRNHELLVTASVGIALLSDGVGSADEILRRADAAMYDAKAHDKNNARFFSPELATKSRNALGMESALRAALAEGQFELHYQPKVDLASGRIAGAEALVRWRRPGAGLTGPGEFIPTAEESGLIVPLGQWILEEACRQTAAWASRSGTAGLRVAVNVAARQFRQRDFVAVVARAAADAALDPHLLELEITEGTLMEGGAAIRATLDALRSMGISITLDDFGTGYSSLGYIRRFPVDALKIDRSFVTDSLVDEGAAAITRAVIAMARQLRLDVVAEGVESAVLLESLRTLGCTLAQGFHCGRPMPAKDFEEFVRARVARPSMRPPLRIAGSGTVSAFPPRRRVA